MENPTSILVKELTEEQKNELGIIDAQVLETSTVGVKNFYESKKQFLKKHHEDHPDHKIFVIHCGVYVGCGSFLLEKFGYNNADFRIPDVQGL